MACCNRRGAARKKEKKRGALGCMIVHVLGDFFWWFLKFRLNKMKCAHDPDKTLSKAGGFSTDMVGSGRG